MSQVSAHSRAAVENQKASNSRGDNVGKIASQRCTFIMDMNQQKPCHQPAAENPEVFFSVVAMHDWLGLNREQEAYEMIGLVR
jgi:hypothetical protein